MFKTLILYSSPPSAGRASLDSFRGIIFVGGFSYADTLDSAKGWAGTIRFNGPVLQQFQVGFQAALPRGPTLQH